MKQKGALWASVGCSLAMALLFGLFFFTSNTPLGPAIGSDNAMYLTMGTALARGYAPYTEIFDHKGPLLFALQALPQALSGGYSMTAVFMLEALCLFAALRLAAGIGKAQNVPEILAQLLLLALSGGLLDGGNLGEEYTIPLALAVLWLAFRAFGTGKERLQGKRLTQTAALVGVCAAAAFLLRANNALPICALTGGLALGLMLQREWKGLGRCVSGFLLGAAVFLGAAAAWLAARHALSAGVYGAILHNLMYAKTGESSRVAMLFGSAYGHRALFLAALSCLGAVALWRQGKGWMLPLALGCMAAGGGLAAFISHKFYVHYLLLSVPSAFFGGAACLSWLAKHLSKDRKMLWGAAALLCCVALGWEGWQAEQSRAAWRADLPAFTQDAQALYARVPEEERGSFMAYRAEPRWYVVTGALPCMRFYFLQEILAQADPAVMDEIVETFASDPPRWLVIYYNRAFSPPYDPRVAEIFATRYTFVDAAGNYQLLRYSDGLGE